MVQVVRRRNTSADSVPGKSTSSLKSKYLELAFVVLASANIFVIALVAAFYYLTHKH